MSNLAEEKRYTYRDYIKWDGDVRYELIDGTAYAMATPSRLHQKISKKIFRQLDDFLTGKTCEVYYAPLAVRLNFDSFDDVVVEPDLFVVCDESKFDNRSVKGAPDLIVEILSPHNARHDTVTKFRQYQRAGVKEYWIVDPNAKTVQVHILENGKYTDKVYRDDDVIPVHVLEGCQINLADVFYDTLELESTDGITIKQRIIEAMKEKGVYTEQIGKIIGSVES